MDGLVESRERGYVCATPVHALMVAQDDHEMMAALRGATLVVPDGMPLVWASNMLGESLDDRVYGPELMRRYSERCAERGHRVWLYGGRDQGTLVQLALSLRRNHPEHPDRGRLLASLPPAGRAGGEHDREQINAAKPGRALGGDRRAEAGEVDGPHARPARRAGHVRRRRRVRLPRGPDPDGAALDAGPRPRVDLPDLPGAGRLLPRYLYYNPRFVLSFARQYLSER